MEIWLDYLSNISKRIKDLDKNKCDLPFFRGHNDSTWKLIPTIHRKYRNKNFLSLENELFFDFCLYCGPLYQRNLKSWDILFEMRHAGIPTKLLDWTENFGSALYFALKDVDWKVNRNKRNPIKPCIWILNPYKLNKRISGEHEIKFVEELQIEYHDTLDGKDFKGPLAILSSREGLRVFSQKSLYTFHGNEKRSLEEAHPDIVTKHEIPLEALKHAQEFLSLAGINEYSLFPDLDGLGRHFKNVYNYK